MTMTEQETTTVAKKNTLSAKVLIIIGIIVIGAAAVTYAFWPTSDKTAYFKAEIETFNYLKDEVTDRFENELAWAEMTKSKPTATTINASVMYNDPYSFGGYNEIEEIVNQSSVTLHTETDMKKEQLLVDAEANIAGINFDDFRIYITDQVLLIDLPFLDDALQIESEDLSKLLYELDPYTFSEDEDYDFSRIFDLDNYPISEDDQQYLREKYGKFIYDELPDDAFSSEKDDVSVAGETIKAEKLTAHITEDNVKDLLSEFFTEIQNDDRFKDIVKDYMKNSFIDEYEIDELLSEFDEGLEEAKDELDNINLPDGIKSTIWVKNDLIVQREFTFTAMDSFDSKGTLNIKGTHDFNKEQQVLDYEFAFDDEFTSGKMTINADLSFKDNEINDQVVLSVDDVKLAYEAHETINKNDREFARSVSFDDSFESGSIHWDGQSTYAKDEMSSDNQIYLEVDDLDGDIFNLSLDVDSKQIREVDTPNPDHIKDIGKMSELEIEEYIYFEAQDQFFNWYMENFGMPGF